ncbi:GNAT family N-acetyltransferase [Microbacterium sp. NIBRBAC000506063]|uniref:GNAT family N-acetyltransferase n=1 Tax=Microbacterium sp. NIBRBAC000506063 TaxID=2734618 RepID=UPI001BB6E9A0|nr:GNAT family protein [Microbacterium sp. NIBRBAC000506063]QTV79925.1 GNAT family N-acetyltransferase [Microbacterium sp. NIBRBAC000506063]
MTHLRLWRDSDAAALLDAARTTADLDTQLGGAMIDTLDAARSFIAEQLTSTDAMRDWAIVHDDAVVGNVGLSAIEHRHKTAWAFYWLAGAARGRGLATRALVAASDWAFAQGVFRIELGHRVNNPASCAVARRAGFLAEGIERQKLAYGDERFDVELHARLATDPVPDIDGLALTDEA